MTSHSIAQLGQDQKAQLGKAGLRMFFELAGRWKLTQNDQLLLLGLSSRTTINEWRRKAQQDLPLKLSVDALERLSLIVGIRKGVEILYPQGRWDSYMRASNRVFAGKSLIDVMLEGSMKSLYEARGYLDASRGAHFG